ncbi:tRNA pseudouridine synthase C [Mariprofundus ferrinatatus]|uniref:tRNA pseudouridine synthase C n=1 Tax=Mariprofundus ferrinatatus TaxID=1921087 RepID=A0A2K8L621_9PROT|nr:tRNA pseudouridine(65) synthase TruC [Mariprofundus ferrinatatus]ATX82737.1 tRNA pseudouridine synthase C [Mariprofundus ferrinatatus]
MLDILYRDEWLIAINKPAGLLVHRSMIDKHETRFAMQMVRDQIGQHVWPLHRLDKPTSGVLLFALNSETARKVGDLFCAGMVSKEYLAVVRGYTEEQGIIDYPLKEELDKKSDQKADSNKPAQDAVTQYCRLATVELPNAVGRYDTARYSLLSITPKTGRKHQIRRHMKHIFHPIVGDTTHGDGRQNTFFRNHFNCRRLLLAATSLNFPHPETGEQITIHAPLEDSFSNVVDLLGWGRACIAHPY